MDVKLEIKHQRQKTKIKQEVAELGNKNVVLKGQEKHLGEFQITESGLRIKSQRENEQVPNSQ